MYKVNKYVPGCVESGEIIFEYANAPEEVMTTNAYQQMVGNRYLYWYASSPFNFQTYLRDVTNNMLFFIQDDNGCYWGALHVVTDTLAEMYQFLTASHAKVVTEKTAPHIEPIDRG